MLFLGKQQQDLLSANAFGQVIENDQALPNIFTAGDNSCYQSLGSNAHSAQSAVRKGKLVARNILRHAGFPGLLEPYVHQDLGYVVNLGPHDAVGWLGTRSNIMTGMSALAIKEILELARQKVVDRIPELPSFSLGSIWARIRGGRDAEEWSRRALWACLLFLLCLAIAVAVRPRTARRILFGLSAVLFLGTALSIAFAAFRHKELTDDSEAIIMSPKVDVRSEPREGSTVLFVLHKGTKVTILQQENTWSEFQLANGSVGWMPPASLERI